MHMFVNVILVWALYAHYAYFYQNGTQKGRIEAKKEGEGKGSNHNQKQGNCGEIL